LRPARLTLQANADIARAAEWYEERSEGLGKRFVDRVLEAITRIEANPAGYALVFKNLRRCNVAKFPYALWFEVRSDKSLVIACLHPRRTRALMEERAAGVIQMPKPPEGF
jgi:toxin ParE1/3/4